MMLKTITALFFGLVLNVVYAQTNSRHQQTETEKQNQILYQALIDTRIFDRKRYSMQILLDAYYEIRGSVSVVLHNNVVEFFKSNTRESIKIVADDKSTEAIKLLNGNKTSLEIAKIVNISEHRLIELLTFLYKECLIHNSKMATFIRDNRYSHVLNFLADYLDDDDILQSFKKLQNSHVVIIGLGGVGSWVTLSLAKTGIENFTLIDNDNVEISNLNRSFYDDFDIGIKKIDAMQSKLIAINSHIKCNTIFKEFDSINLIEGVIKSVNNKDILVINCADKPNVDTTSSWLNKACLNTNTPYIIAGGYNLHLSLLGPTIIPFITACFECIQKQLMKK